MAIGGVSSRRLPSVDPEIERAAHDVVRDPDAYFMRQRALRELEAEEYVEQELRAISIRRRRPSLRAFLASLYH